MAKNSLTCEIWKKKSGVLVVMYVAFVLLGNVPGRCLGLLCWTEAKAAVQAARPAFALLDPGQGRGFQASVRPPALFGLETLRFAPPCATKRA